MDDSDDSSDTSSIQPSDDSDCASGDASDDLPEPRRRSLTDFDRWMLSHTDKRAAAIERERRARERNLFNIRCHEVHGIQGGQKDALLYALSPSNNLLALLMTVQAHSKTHTGTGPLPRARHRLWISGNAVLRTCVFP